eukprot:scaffold361094_cov30-Prasinocladus_malaysianus.AAC.1
MQIRSVTLFVYDLQGLPLSEEQRQKYVSLLESREALQYATGRAEDGATSRGEEWLIARAMLRKTLSRYCEPGVTPQVVSTHQSRSRLKQN